MTPNIGFFAQSFADWSMQSASSRRVVASTGLSLDAANRSSASTEDHFAASPEARLKNLFDRFRRDTTHSGTLTVSVPLSEQATPTTDGFGTGDPKMEKDLDLLLRMISGDEDEYRRLKAKFTDMMKAVTGTDDVPATGTVVTPAVPASDGAPAASDAPETIAGTVVSTAVSQQFTRVESSSGASIMVDAVTGRPIPLNEAMTKAVQEARSAAEQTGAMTASKVFAGGEVHLKFERISGRIEIQDVQFVAIQGKADPLVLDLAGDGINLRDPENGVEFDINGDGKVEKTGWVQGDDALLVLDRNGNGTIDNGRELFGDQNGAANGFQELQKLDFNKDGVVDTRDPMFRALKLYRDINSNGRIDKNELIPLDAAGVATISLSFLRQPKEQGGNSLLLNGSFTTNDGRQGQVADVLFGYRGISG